MVRVDTTAGDVKIDGFTIRNAGGTAGLRIAVMLKSVGAINRTLTFSNNRIEGRGANDYGFDSDHGGMAVKFLNNTVTGTGFNPILIERNTAAVELRGNTVTAPFSFFFMSHSGDAITAPRWWPTTRSPRRRRHSASTARSPARRSATFSDVTIENNVINAGTSSAVTRPTRSTLAGGANGLITNAVVRGNTLTGIAAVNTRGVNVSGNVVGTRVEANTIRSFASGIRSATNASNGSPTGVIAARNRIVGNGVGLENASGTPADASATGGAATAARARPAATR